LSLNAIMLVLSCDSSGLVNAIYLILEYSVFIKTKRALRPFYI